MGRWLPKEDRIRMAERCVELRDKEGLEWKDVAERLGLYSGTNAVYYYNKGKKAEKIVEETLKFEEIEPFARKYGIERGYVWLYENGFRKRVPANVRLQIEDAKMGIGAVNKKPRALFEKRDGRTTDSRGKEGHRRSPQEQLELGKRAVELKNEGLSWRQISERLGVKQSSSVQVYCRKYKRSLGISSHTIRTT